MHDHGTTAAAVVVAAGLTAVFGWITLGSLLSWIDPSRIDNSFARGSLGFGGGGNNPGEIAQNTTAIITVVFGATVVTTAVLTVGLAFRQIWAREGAMFVFGMLGIFSVSAALAGFAASPPAPAAWFGILTGLVNWAIVALLVAPPTRRDFDPYAHYRRVPVEAP